jgi:hypothetical protein
VVSKRKELEERYTAVLDILLRATEHREPDVLAGRILAAELEAEHQVNMDILAEVMRKKQVR